ncbi:glycosyltransferase [Gillisia sp. M10.2A]|uniref:Glycosyltransferase n=1 Tax=Gillisia lutea TaxID=2909668 RepID=A0ABS9EGX4_9FLAO|nr:glycosyltransferase [Gillisia lutea]
MDVLKSCIGSLLSTVHNKTYISLVSNGSSRTTEDYLHQLYNEGVIHELILTNNIGKLNSIYKAIAGNNIPLITISDADVFFLAGWQEETYKVFNNFSKAGTVGLIPQFLSYQSYSQNLLFDNFFSNKLKFGLVKDPDGLRNFYESLGWKNDYPESRLKYILYLKKNGVESIVGSGHVVATYRRELFGNLNYFNPYKMGGDSERILDELAGRYDMYRLTTPINKAFHIGNKLPKEKFKKLNSDHNLVDIKIEFPRFTNEIKRTPKFLYSFKKNIIRTVLKSYKLRMLFLKQLGLPKPARKSF